MSDIRYLLGAIIILISFSTCKLRKPVFNGKQTELLIGNVQRIARITGNTLPGEKLHNPNNTSNQYDVGGTDLGIMWEMANQQIGIFFGDTNGKDYVAFKGNGGGNGSNWRSNVLAFSKDDNLEDGLTISGMALDGNGDAREVIAGGKANPKVYQTSIPTGAVHANGADYVHYMNIYEWAAPKGRWLTNFSSIYASYDHGITWNRKKNLTFSKESKFSQVCYAKKDGYIYMLGTLSGRGSGAYLARFRERNIENPSAYEYWNGLKNQWIKSEESYATPVVPGPVGEASLLYHKKFNKWIVMYIYDYKHDKNPVVRQHAIVYREASEINGTWSKLKVLTTAATYPGLYSPYLHPSFNDKNEIYFTMSMWGPYNVFLMKASISQKE